MGKYLSGCMQVAGSGMSLNTSKLQIAVVVMMINGDDDDDDEEDDRDQA